jgi:hypothetical protein
MFAMGHINLDQIISRVAGYPEKMHSGEYVKAVLNPQL